MQNDYLNNKKNYITENIEKEKISHKTKVSQKNKVDINKLLNRVRSEKKIKNEQNLIITGLVLLAIAITAVISIF
jgi:hypothetical protein